MLVVPAVVDEAFMTSLNELEAVGPPARLPLVIEFVPAWAAFSFVLEASDLESSWPGLGLDGAMMESFAAGKF